MCEVILEVYIRSGGERFFSGVPQPPPPWRPVPSFVFLSSMLTKIKGRKAEEGIEGKYELIETPSANYVQRTE